MNNPANSEEEQTRFYNLRDRSEAVLNFWKHVNDFYVMVREAHHVQANEVSLDSLEKVLYACQTSKIKYDSVIQEFKIN